MTKLKDVKLLLEDMANEAYTGTIARPTCERVQIVLKELAFHLEDDFNKNAVYLNRCLYCSDTFMYHRRRLACTDCCPTAVTVTRPPLSIGSYMRQYANPRNPEYASLAALTEEGWERNWYWFKLNLNYQKPTGIVTGTLLYRLYCSTKAALEANGTPYAE